MENKSVLKSVKIFPNQDCRFELDGVQILLYASQPVLTTTPWGGHGGYYYRYFTDVETEVQRG